jgi:hypothetical protein
MTCADAKAQVKTKLTLEPTVVVKWEPDCDADLSMLGEYSNTAEEGAIDREERGDMGRGEYRYWNPANHGKYNPKDWEHVSGKEKRGLIKKHGSLKNTVASYRMEDYKRHEDYNRGQWQMEGCIVTVRLGELEGTSSLWGIESDCGEDYRAEVIADVTVEALNALEDKVMARLAVE